MSDRHGNPTELRPVAVWVGLLVLVLGLALAQLR